MRLVKRASYFLITSVVSLGLVACGSDDDGDNGDNGDECYDSPIDCVDPDGTDTQFVVNDVTMPTNATQAQELGLDLDGDPQSRPDNALGQILSTLAAQGDLDLQEAVDVQLANGGLLILLNVRAKDLAQAADVGAWVLLGGTATPAPCVDAQDIVCGRHLDGNGVFDIDPESPMNAILPGNIVAGKFTGGPGEVTLELALGEDSAPITLNMVGARVEMNVTATGITNGRIGGAVTSDELDTNVLPAIAVVIDDTLGSDCTGTPPDCCTAGSTGETLIDLFDDCSAGSTTCDCSVSLGELRENDLISSLLAPDVDLLDTDGSFAPRTDEIKDSLSLGIGFTTTTGSFPAP